MEHSDYYNNKHFTGICRVTVRDQLSMFSIFNGRAPILYLSMTPEGDGPERVLLAKQVRTLANTI